MLRAYGDVIFVSVHLPRYRTVQGDVQVLDGITDPLEDDAILLTDSLHVLINVLEHVGELPGLKYIGV